MILVIEDESVQRLLLGRSLAQGGYDAVEMFDDATSARAFLGWDGASADPRAGSIELFMLDYNLPDGNGVDLIAQIRDDERFADTPILMVTANEYEGTLTRAFAAGANDYLSKPFRPNELLARLRGLIGWKREADRRRKREAELRVVLDELEQTNAELEAREGDLLRLTGELRNANAQLAELSRRDPGTGIPNRRSFEEQLGREWRRGLRLGTPVGVIMIDLDAFKAYNDNYGHPEGDRCLLRVAQTIDACARRAGDTAARLGGEEFVVLLPGNTDTQTALVADRMREEIEALAIPHAAHGPGVVTASLGVASMVPQVSLGPDALISRADRALYRAKEAGRNRVDVDDSGDDVEPQPALDFGEPDDLAAAAG